MATTLKFSGTTSVTEGENATVTVTRYGDLSKRIVVRLDNHGSWGLYPLEALITGDDAQNIAPHAQGGDSTGTLVFEPGMTRQSVSIRTIDDRMMEGREVMTVVYSIYEDVGGVLLSAPYGIDNSENPWPRDGDSTIGPWTIMVNDRNTTSTPIQQPQPQVTQTTPFASQTFTPQVPPSVVNNITTNVDNSVTYNDNSVNNTYVNSFNADNSVNDSFNTDNSVTSYSLSYVTNANDYSIGKTISGSGTLRGTAENDLLIGGRKKDRLYGDVGNDELIGGSGKDRLYGGLGSNTYNAGTSKSKKDADRLYLTRETNAVNADIIEAIGKSDRIYIQGSTGNLDVRGIDGGLGIFDNNVLQAIYTGNNFNASTLSNQLIAA